MEVQGKSHIQVTGGRFVIFNSVIEKIELPLSDIDNSVLDEVAGNITVNFKSGSQFKFVGDINKLEEIHNQLAK
ncbi:hypothetical protein P4576_15050 [Peribacillus frigoritolerans]|uniref:hypothetical protein n=1 Tax=Peribacillus frigoritolerans TaxID=450367 RepID=UPI002E1C9967|nr:hypothetical protein [Peribacillus frigoritolerans]